jgi:lipoprotein-anchoring transpeptidase ErfK/SrfK
VLGTVGPRTEFGSPDVLSVARIDDGWLGVVSELAGNGRLGWIPLSAVTLGRDSFQLQASLSGKNLVVLAAGRVLARYPIGIGASWAPTPIGKFAVTDRILTGDPSGPYGCCIVALTATAPHAIPGWTGGNRIAIHATAETESIGQPDSHGCLRVTAANASWLVQHVPAGTPVTITS